MDDRSGAAGFVGEQRFNRRATVVILIGTFALLVIVANLVAALFGGYTKQSCETVSYGYGTGYGYRSCTTVGAFRPGILVGTVAVVVAYLAFAYLLSGRAALGLAHARPADGPEYAGLRDVVSQMANAAGLPEPKVYVVDDPAPNAFATGRSPKTAAVTVTTGLLATMSHRELRGVIAHEMSHVRNRDIAVTTLAVLAVGVIAVLAQIALRIGMFTRFSRNRDAGAIGLVFAMLGLLLYLLAVPAGLLLKAALSRRREALADATAVELTREPTGLRSALEKLEADQTVVARPSPAIAHLWIESPLERKEAGLAGSIGRLFDTHPPLADRIATLRGYEGLDPAGRGPNDPYPGRG